MVIEGNMRDPPGDGNVPYLDCVKVSITADVIL